VRTSYALLCVRSVSGTDRLGAGGSALLSGPPLALVSLARSYGAGTPGQTAPSEGYYEEVRIILKGSKSESGTLMDTGPRLCELRRRPLPRTPLNKPSADALGAQDESVLKHKLPSDTDFSARTCYTRYLKNSDRLRSLDIRWRQKDASSSRLF